MDRYRLTNEGRWRFKRVKSSAEPVKMEGYEILDYLYESGPGTIEEIMSHAGLSRLQVVDKLLAFMQQGYVEKVAALRLS